MESQPVSPFQDHRSSQVDESVVTYRDTADRVYVRSGLGTLRIAAGDESTVALLSTQEHGQLWVERKRTRAWSLFAGPRWERGLVPGGIAAAPRRRPGAHTLPRGGRVKGLGPPQP